MTALAYLPILLGVGGITGATLWLVQALTIAPWSVEPTTIAAGLALMVGATLASLFVLLVGALAAVAGGVRA